MRKLISALLFLSYAITLPAYASFVPAATKVDDAAFTPATDNVDMFGAEFDDSSPDSVDEGDAGALRMSAKRALYVNIRDNAGNERGLNIDASGNLTANITGTATVDTELPAAATIAADGAAPTVPGVASYSFVKTPGANTWDRQYSVVNGTDSTGTGITATGILAQLDDAATGSVTENQFANVRLSSRRALLVEGVASGTAVNVLDTNSASALTSLQLIDDGVYTDDTSTHSTGSSKGYAIMGAATPTDTAVNANDLGIVGMTNNRELYVSLRDISGTAAVSGSGTATGALRVELANNGTGTLSTVSTVTNVTNIATSVTPGTSAAHLGKAEDAIAGSGDTGVATWGVANEAQSTLAADGDYVAQAVDTKGNRLTVGNLANDAVDAGNPVKVGAQARTTNPTAVADADRVNLIADKLGKLISVSAIRDLKGVQKTTITSSTSETTIVTAAASTFLDLYGLTIANTSATACNVTIKDSTAGTTRFILAVPAGETRGFMLDPGSAVPQATVNTNWTATCSASVASIEITALYVKNT